MTKSIIPFVVLIIALTGARFFFPPLTELGYTELPDDMNLRVMINRNGGVDPMQLYIEMPDEADLQNINDILCATMVDDKTSGTMPIQGLPETGNSQFNFVTDGRYFYRWRDKKLLDYSYALSGCTLKEMANG